MIDLYTQTTPNGRKAMIMMEELGVPYNLHLLNFSAGEQKAPDYLKINPNGKIPAIVDPDGSNGEALSVFESGAILIYLAEKFNSPLLPSDGAVKSRAIQWLMFQMGAIGPMFGQAGYFARFAPEPVPAAIERYTAEAYRLLGVLETRLTESPFLAGPEYTIADIATWPWIMGTSMIGLDITPYPKVDAWSKTIGERPAVRRAMLIGAS